MKLNTLMFTAAAFALVAQGLSGPAEAARKQDKELRAEIEALKEGQAAISKELAEIKKLLQQGGRAAPAGPDVTGKIFNLGNNPSKGSSRAKVALLEFTDYQCPYCKRHSENTHPQIEREYVDGGKIRFVSLDMPLRFHKLAPKAAEASHCAEEQGQYWEMRNRLFANQKALEPWDAHAEALGLDVDQYETCLNSSKYKVAVSTDMAEAMKAGATGTPSFIVARIDEKDASKVHGLKFIQGAQPFAVFQQALDEALASVK